MQIAAFGAGKPTFQAEGNIENDKCRLNGGGGGIRTPGTLAGPTVFKTARFDRSRTPPFPILSAGAIHRAICDTWEFRLLCFGAYATKTSHNSLPIRLRETTP